jgi:hypothetical protein
MYSSRTANSECVNSQNAYGFHLSDGSIFTYQTGDEYVDVFGAWNWNLVPGITVDVDGTPLDCSQVKETGKKHFVGGATDGNTGIAVMDYINPINYNLAFKKTVFFFPSGYGVQIGPVTSKNSSAPLVSVLDQRRRNGEIYINGAQKDTDTSYNVSSTKTVWHDSIGYYFPTPQNIYIDSEPRKADWASFGISEGSETSQLFTSYIKHNTTKTSGLLMQYIAQPQVSQADFASSISQKVPFHIAHKITKKLHVNAAYSETDKTIALAFWTKGTYQAWHVKVTSSQPCVLLLRETGDSTYRLTVADPTHKLKSVKLRFVINSVSRSITVRLPSGKDVGQDIVKNISFASSKSSS